MKTHRHKPIKVTEHFYQLGTVSFPVYLSLGQNGMIIEGGTGATSAIIVDQIRQLGIDPQRIKYVVLTHTHTDHIGAIPHLQKLWPHLKVAASPLALKLLAHERTVRDFLANDRAISEIMLSKGEIQSPPPQLEQYVFHVDQVLEEGAKFTSKVLFPLNHSGDREGCRLDAATHAVSCLRKRSIH